MNLRQEFESAPHLVINSIEDFDAVVAAAKQGTPLDIPELEHAVIGGVYMKQIAVATAGVMLVQHSHHYAHATLVANGAVALKIDGKVALYKAPAMINVPAGVKHQFITLADNTVLYCVHKVRDEDVVDDFVKEVAEWA